MGTALTAGQGPPSARSFSSNPFEREMRDARTPSVFEAGPENSTYDRRTFGDVVVVRPREAWQDRQNPLNQTVSEIEWSDVTAADAVFYVWPLVYGPLATWSSKPPNLESADPRTFSVNLKSGTVLDVLIAVAHAHGRLGWFVPGMPAPFTFSIGARTFDDEGRLIPGPSWGTDRVPPSMLGR
jgi:hypothetical protein